MKGRWISYSAEELAFIHSVSQWPRADAHAAFCQKFRRDDVSLSNFHSLCKRKGWMTGRSGRIEKGSTPHNKGKPCAPGAGGRHPNARKTQFKKGERNGVAIKLYKEVGTERVTEDGYLERKINDDKPECKRWRLVHLIEWEAANGPVPKGHCLKCLDGNKLNTGPENWELIPRALLPRLAGGNRYRRVLAFDDAAPELKPTVLAVAKLEHRSREARKGPAA